MADGSNGRVPVGQKPVAETPKFFSINGRYIVAEEATPEDLLNDVGCIAECAEAGIQSLIDGLADDGSAMQSDYRHVTRLLFGVLYQVQMMANLANGALLIAKPQSEVSNG